MGDENSKWIVGRSNRKIDKRRSGHCISRFSYDCREVTSGELPTHIAGHCVSFFGEYSKVLPVTCRQAQWASRFIHLLNPNFGTRWGWVVNTLHPARTLVPIWGGWLGPRAGLEGFWRRKNSLPHRSSNPGWICFYNLFICESNVTIP